MIAKSMKQFITEHPDIKYVFFGGKGGVGKTVMAGAAALWFAQRGLKTLLASTNERAHYILQERIAFAPVIDTPDGPTQAEIRVMYVWSEEAKAFPPVLPLIRMGRGKMMGVDHNKGLRWVGASAAFMSPGD